MTTPIKLASLGRPAKASPNRRALGAPHRPLHARQPPAAPPAERPLPELTAAEFELLRAIAGRHGMRVDPSSAAAWRLHREGLIRIEAPVSRYESRVAWRRSSDVGAWTAVVVPRGRRLLGTTST